MLLRLIVLKFWCLGDRYAERTFRQRRYRIAGLDLLSSPHANAGTVQAIHYL
jgi:hypothetical protein